VKGSATEETDSTEYHGSFSAPSENPRVQKMKPDCENSRFLGSFPRHSRDSLRNVTNLTTHHQASRPSILSLRERPPFLLGLRAMRRIVQT
jgi:hypothetical protein